MGVCLAVIDDATQAARDLAASAVGRSDGVWLAAILIVCVFGLLGLLFHFVVVPWGKSQIEIGRARAAAEEKRSEELSNAVKVLCDVTGRSHTLAQSTDEGVSRIEQQLDHCLTWMRSGTEAMEVLAEGAETNPRLRTALGVMRGSLLWAGEPATAELPAGVRRGQG